MRNIEASPHLQDPQLIETKAAMVNGRRINEFAMSFVITRAQVDSGGKKK